MIRPKTTKGECVKNKGQQTLLHIQFSIWIRTNALIPFHMMTGPKWSVFFRARLTYLNAGVGQGDLTVGGACPC